MTPDSIVKVLKALGAKHVNKAKRSGNVISSCPLAPWRHEHGVSGQEVFAAKISQGDPPANCFACGWKGRLGELTTLVKYFDDRNPSGRDFDFKTANALVLEAMDTEEFDAAGMKTTEQKLVEAVEALHEFPQWWLGTFPPAWGVQWARDYLVKRDVDAKMAADLDLKADPFQRRICFPVRGFDGKLYGLHGRAVDPDVNPRYRMYQHKERTNPIIWLGEHWVDRDKPVIIVEGPFDLMSVRRVYKNVVSPLFATPSDAKLKRMSVLDNITLFDRGTGGDQGRLRVSLAYKRQGQIVRHLLPTEGRKDPGEMTKDEIYDLLYDYVQLTP